MDFLQILLLGIVQGISEWLPISSKTLDTFLFLSMGGQPSQSVAVLLYLHLGTLVAATIYFRHKLWEMAKELLSVRAIDDLKKDKFTFYLFALAGTGVVGLPLYLLQKYFLSDISASMLFVVMGVGLLVTSALLFVQKGKVHEKKATEAGWFDGLVCGAFQGLSALPGISRSGTSTTGLILRKFEPDAAFELSFILSIPSVIGAELVLYLLNSSVAIFDPIAGLMLAATSFVFGYLTIGMLIGFAKKVNLAMLALAFALVMIVAGLIGLS
ncbi:MAG: undecaprenyl-diphosphate phosphatase [Candidatus Micrarchaeia archaeon]